MRVRNLQLQALENPLRRKIVLQVLSTVSWGQILFQCFRIVLGLDFSFASLLLSSMLFVGYSFCLQQLIFLYAPKKLIASALGCSVFLLYLYGFPNLMSISWTSVTLPLDEKNYFSPLLLNCMVTARLELCVVCGIIISFLTCHSFIKKEEHLPKYANPLFQQTTLLMILDSIFMSFRVSISRTLTFGLLTVLLYIPLYALQPYYRPITQLLIVSSPYEQESLGLRCGYDELSFATLTIPFLSLLCLDAQLTTFIFEFSRRCSHITHAQPLDLPLLTHPQPRSDLLYNILEDPRSIPATVPTDTLVRSDIRVRSVYPWWFVVTQFCLARYIFTSSEKRKIIYSDANGEFWLNIKNACCRVILNFTDELTAVTNGNLNGFGLWVFDCYELVVWSVQIISQLVFRSRWEDNLAILPQNNAIPEILSSFTDCLTACDRFSQKYSDPQKNRGIVVYLPQVLALKIELSNGIYNCISRYFQYLSIWTFNERCKEVLKDFVTFRHGLGIS